MQTADHVANKARRSMWAVCVLATGLLAVAGAILFAAVNRPEPFDPLGPYPQQQVDEPRDNTEPEFNCSLMCALAEGGVA